MSASVHILVSIVDGKPKLTLAPTPTVRAYTRKGSAESYAEGLTTRHEYWRQHDIRAGRDPKPPLDIRVLTIAIPDEGPAGDGMWPDLLPELAVKWS